MEIYLYVLWNKFSTSIKINMVYGMTMTCEVTPNMGPLAGTFNISVFFLRQEDMAQQLV